MLKNILGRIFALWCLLLFAGTMLIVFIPIWIFSFWPDPIKSRGFLAIGRIWMIVYMPLIGCPVRRRGTEYLTPGQTYVIVCNHNSLIDVPVTTAKIPGANKTLAKSSMGKIPLFGVLYRIGGIMVDRSSEASRKQSETCAEPGTAHPAISRGYPQPYQRTTESLLRRRLRTGHRYPAPADALYIITYQENSTGGEKVLCMATPHRLPFPPAHLHTGAYP